MPTYNASPNTLNENDAAPLLLDSQRRLVTTGGGSINTAGTTSSSGIGQSAEMIQYSANQTPFSDQQFINARSNKYGDQCVDTGRMIGAPDYQKLIALGTSSTPLIPAVGENGRPIVKFEIQNQSASTIVFYNETGAAATTDGNCPGILGNYSVYSPEITTDRGVTGIVTTGTANVNVKYWTA